MNSILASNASSAVVATVRQSTLKNPFAYSERDLVPPHALQHLTVAKSGGSVGASSTVNFDIPKQGYACGMWLVLDMPALNVAASDTVADGSVDADGNPITDAIGTNVDSIHPAGLYECIKEVRLETSGRVIESLSRENIMARLSNLPFGARGACERAARMAGDAEDNSTYKAVLYLPFFMYKNEYKYSINTSFSEPHRVSVSFTDCTCKITTESTATAYTAHTPTDGQLLVHYRNLDDQDQDATINANYGDGLLSRLITRQVNEAVHTVSAAEIGATAPGHTNTVSTKIDLRQTDAVSAIYVQVKCPKHTLTAGAGNLKKFLQMGAPLRCKSIKLTASGMTIADVPAEFLQFFGRWGHGSGGDGMPAYSASGLDYVYKLDFTTGQGEHTGIVSLRELSNPRLEIEFYPAFASQPHEVFVSYDAETFLSENASTGRVTLSIAS